MNLNYKSHYKTSRKKIVYFIKIGKNPSLRWQVQYASFKRNMHVKLRDLW